MSAVQVQNFVQFRRLLAQLRGYGLNPNDWQIDRSTWTAAGEFSLRHRADDEFTIAARAKARKGNLQLSDLRVVSL